MQQHAASQSCENYGCYDDVDSVTFEGEADDRKCDPDDRGEQKADDSDLSDGEAAVHCVLRLRLECFIERCPLERRREIGCQ